MRKRTSLYWLLPAVAGLAMIAVAVLLSSASPGGRIVPSAQAQNINNLCDLQIHKEQVDERDILVRAEKADINDDDDIAYLITVRNLAEDDPVDEKGCDGILVTDFLGDDLECEDAFVVGGSIDYGSFEIEGCKVEKEFSGVTGDDHGGTVTFSTEDTLPPGGEVELALVANVDQRPGECVENRACVEEGAFDSTGIVADRVDSGNCDEVRTCERRRETATPTVAPTNTPLPPTPTATPYVPPPAPPTAKPLATISAPPTGSGANGGSSPWLALGLGLGGVCLLVVSGAALARKRVR